MAGQSAGDAATTEGVEADDRGDHTRKCGFGGQGSNQGVEDVLGWSVALDGGDAFVGAPHLDEVVGAAPGAVYAFARPTKTRSTKGAPLLPAPGISFLVVSDSSGGDRLRIVVAWW